MRSLVRKFLEGEVLVRACFWLLQSLGTRVAFMQVVAIMRRIMEKAHCALQLLSAADRGNSALLRA